MPLVPVSAARCSAAAATISGSVVQQLQQYMLHKHPDIQNLVRYEVLHLQNSLAFHAQPGGCSLTQTVQIAFAKG